MGMAVLVDVVVGGGSGTKVLKWICFKRNDLTEIESARPDVWEFGYQLFHLFGRGRA